MVEESTVSDPILEPEPCEKILYGKGLRKVQGWWKSPRSVNASFNPSLLKNTLRQGSKEEFKDGTRVHGQ
ncbi:hypothetical protein KY289_008451 [Solanum tuberosum]|nr:hypothetical protein KY289_008451 [Solanum tuberosum]